MLSPGKLLIGNNKAWFGSNKIELTKDTVYSHPTEKQCNYSYVHPSDVQCDVSSSITSLTTRLSSLESTVSNGITDLDFGEIAANGGNSGSWYTLKTFSFTPSILIGVVCEYANSSTRKKTQGSIFLLSGGLPQMVEDTNKQFRLTRKAFQSYWSSTGSHHYIYYIAFS